jgi:hypothetical protein
MTTNTRIVEMTILKYGVNYSIKEVPANTLAQPCDVKATPLLSGLGYKVVHAKELREGFLCGIAKEDGTDCNGNDLMRLRNEMAKGLAQGD